MGGAGGGGRGGGVRITRIRKSSLQWYRIIYIYLFIYKFPLLSVKVCLGRGDGGVEWGNRQISRQPNQRHGRRIVVPGVF